MKNGRGEPSPTMKWADCVEEELGQGEEPVEASEEEKKQKTEDERQQRGAEERLRGGGGAEGKR